MKLKPLSNRKGQMEISIVVFVVVIIGLILVAPIVLKVVNSVSTPFANSISNMSEEAGNNVTHVTNTFVSFWDFVIMFGFLVNLIILILSAFLIDTHPAFIMVFIIFAVLLLIFAPEISSILTKIYDNPAFALETSQLAMVDFLREYLWVIVMGVYLISGVIIYGRLKGGSSSI